MNIVIASRLFLPEPGAAALRLGGLAQALADRDYSVTVLTSTYQKQTAYLPSVKIKRLPVLRDKLGAVRGYFPYLSFDIPLFFRLLVQRNVKAVICEPPPTTGLITRIACAIKKVPYVYFAGDILTDATKEAGAPAIIVKTVEKLEQFAMRGASLVITVTPGVDSRAKELGAKSTVLVPNGVDTQQYRGDIPKDFPSNKRVLLYAGTTSPVHGSGIFISAFRIVHELYPDSELVYLGQGADWENLKRQASLTSLPIRFLPLVPNEVAKGWYKHATIGLVSLTDNNYSYAYATKCLSSLSQGTPVVYVGGGQTKLDIEQNNLGLVASYSTNEVAENIIALLQAIDSGTSPVPEKLIEWVENNRSLKTSSNLIVDSLITRVLNQ